MIARVTECVEDGARWVCTEIPPEMVLDGFWADALTFSIVLAGVCVLVGSLLVFVWSEGR